jgi:ParB family transcriptional regulator, chromosome partitioning protein
MSNSRKSQLRSLFGTQPEPETERAPEVKSAEALPATPAPAAPPPAAEPPKRATSGAVKAMGLSLGALSQEVEDARKLRDALTAADQVVELDPKLIEKSPFADRLSDGATNDETFAELKTSIAEHGQQVPVLVRPHADPEKAGQGLFQIAYGHRRVAAARELGRPVRAVVRNLDNDQLVVAQGKENAEHRALSFIERALFAKLLLDKGFSRTVAQSALSVHKSEMSRLVQVAEAIPHHVAHAIGPAPKAGRPRWLALGELITVDRAGFVNDELQTTGFREADSDTRFQRLFDRLMESARTRGLKKRPGKQGTEIMGHRGLPIAQLSRAGRATQLVIPDSAGEGFAEYLAERLIYTHAAYETALAEGKFKPKGTKKT